METVGVVRTGAGLAAEQRAGLLANSAVLHVRLLGLFLLRCRRTVLLAVRTEPFAFWGRLHVLVHTHLNTTWLMLEWQMKFQICCKIRFSVKILSGVVFWSLHVERIKAFERLPPHFAIQPSKRTFLQKIPEILGLIGLQFANELIWLIWSPDFFAEMFSKKIENVLSVEVIHTHQEASSLYACSLDTKLKMTHLENVFSENQRTDLGIRYKWPLFLAIEL